MTSIGSRQKADDNPIRRTAYCFERSVRHVFEPTKLARPSAIRQLNGGMGRFNSTKGTYFPIERNFITSQLKHPVVTVKISQRLECLNKGFKGHFAGTPSGQ